MINMKINCGMMSLNNAYIRTRSGARIKSKECKKYEERFASECLRYRKALDKLSQNFDMQTNYLKVTYIFNMPKAKLFTKKGRINLRSGDVDNVCKIPNDILFNKIVEVDDAFICELNVSKQKSDTGKNYIDLTIEVGTFEE